MKADKRNGLPYNLYRKSQSGRDYYQYKHPLNGKFFGLGYDKELAIKRTKELNALFAAHNADNKVQQIFENKDKPTKAKNAPKPLTWHEALIKYWHIFETNLKEREIAKQKSLSNTLATRKVHVRALSTLPNWDMDSTPMEVMIQDTRRLLDQYKREDKERTAQSIRSCMIDVFKQLRHHGLWLNNLDPASAIIPPRPQVKRSRLTLDDFKKILFHVEQNSEYPTWFYHALLLAVTTSHCNAELSALTYTPTNPLCFIDDEYLYITRHKTTNRVKIPLDYKLEAVGHSLRDIINMTKDGIKTDYVLHHPRAYRKPAGSQVHVNQMSRQFAKARDELGITGKGKTPPTFYELRSLSERLAADQGVNTQKLMAHRYAKSTALYDDPRGEFDELKLE